MDAPKDAGAAPSGDGAGIVVGLVPEGKQGVTSRVRSVAVKFWRELTPTEMSGALGDLGVFLPLTIGLVKTNGLDLGTTLVFSGAYNVLTGLAFGVPMPVQPMKTIAAVALSERPLTVAQIAFAGMAVSAAVTLLGLTGLVDHFNRVVPPELVRGVQLGLGVKLAIKGVADALFLAGKKDDWLPALAYDGLVMSLCCFSFILLSQARNDAADERDAGARGARREGDRAERGEGGMADVLPTAGGCCGAALLVPSEGGADVARAEARGAAPPVYREVAGGEAGARVGSGRGPGRAGSAGPSSGPTSEGGSAATPATAGPGEVDRDGPLHHPRTTAGRRRWLALPQRVPAALVLVVLGAVLAAAYHPSVLTALRPGPSTPRLIVGDLDWALVRDALLRAALPQLPLTTLNSVVSVCDLSGRLFPDRPARPSHVATSVGVMNLTGGWFGAIPCCHGAGGLAAQARFGARTGTAPVFLGLVKLLLGLLLGSSLVGWFALFPATVLGSMLVFSGLELASVAAAQRGRSGVWVMLFTAAASMATDTWWGFVGGGAAALLLSVHARGGLREWWAVTKANIRGKGAEG